MCCTCFGQNSDCTRNELCSRASDKVRYECSPCVNRFLIKVISIGENNFSNIVLYSQKNECQFLTKFEIFIKALQKTSSCSYNAKSVVYREEAMCHTLTDALI